ncbi:glycosyl transferase family 2 [Beutenbergia cavernae DSM 12333]|uniref:Glycosyl transferase family 2 n=1 Tax=Beutenbergia cavernae (strain ATCC BAA-8 / DSM 12333 / CCUG 43141 / JCM 11478 / NBRC 16432 / NCIMB 13614 / HKI 0122) TaxID=471853 RepID=C5C073_BEUC1|nr:glycosyltransferase family 2 protein [Beutenbergia cavernae]ACQ79259.1 glycosyl transferase family 2 [Beutenbergia cavernae DSM 12333]
MTTAQRTRLRVSICTLTFRRAEDLRRALPMLVEQARSVAHDVEVLVIDNDTAASAVDVVLEDGSGLVRYVHEPRPGIAAARNRALAETLGRDLVVFIDDDERPVQDWLAQLLATYLRTRPAGVVGPVVSEFDEAPEPWIVDGQFFTRLRHPTGTRVAVAATNNLLLDRAFLARHGLTFDERFGLSGGSDSLLTRRLTQAGGVLVWCDEAGVVDVVPAARATRSWVMRRAFRMGNTATRVELEVAARPAGRAAGRVRMATRGAVRIAGGAARAAVGAVTVSRGRRARGWRTVARGAGMLAGTTGYVYHEYRRA